MKIIFVQTNYPGFLDSFYSKIKDPDKMSYKEIATLWADEFFGTSDFYLKNLRPLGWTGREIVLNDWIMQSKWMKEHKFPIKNRDFSFSKIIPPRIKNLLGLSGWMKEIFFRQLRYSHPDVLYFHDLTIFSDSDFKKIRKYTKLIVGQIAYPLPLNENVLKNYDLIISSFPHFVKRFKEMGIKSEYLRWCVEGTVPEAIGEKERVYDVSYVGGFTPHHSKGNKILESVAKSIHVDFWGYGENFLLPTSPIRKTLQGNAWGRQMYEIFAKSKIVINRHINIAENYANNMRMFDATAMGALLITDHKSNMKEFFDVGTEVVTYRNTEELINKVNHYLKNDSERLKIAKAGKARTLKDHTYKVRMKELDLILKKYI